MLPLRNTTTKLFHHTFQRMLFLAHQTVLQHSETHFKILNYWDIFAASFTDAVVTVIGKISYCIAGHS